MNFWRRIPKSEIYEIQVDGSHEGCDFLARGIATGPVGEVLPWISRHLGGLSSFHLRSRAVTSLRDGAMRKLVRSLFHREGGAIVIGCPASSFPARLDKIMEAVFAVRNSMAAPTGRFCCLAGLPELPVFDAPNIITVERSEFLYNAIEDESASRPKIAA